MMQHVSALLLLACVANAKLMKPAGYIRAEHEFVLSPRPKFDLDALPANFDWRNVDGKSYVTTG